MAPTPRPDMLAYTPLPVYGVPPPDKTYIVESYVSGLEAGRLRDAAMLCDAMLRDDRINGIVAARINGLLAMPLEMEPAEDSEPARGYAHEVEALWEDMFPDEALADLLFWGRMLGVGLGQLTWELTSDTWTPTLHVWHPAFVHFDYGTGTYWVVTKEKQVEITPGDGTWILYTPFGFERGFMRGHIRSLAGLWLKRAWALRDAARFSEIHGQPIRKAIVPLEASDKEKREFLESIADLGSESVIRLPQSEAAKFDLQLLEAQSQGFQGFMSFLDKLETAMAVNLLGQNLTTEVQGGSYAAARMHDAVRSDFRRADARSLSVVLYQQAIRPYIRFNHGDDAVPLAPYPYWETEPPEDSEKASRELSALADALGKFRAAGAPVDIREVLESYGVPLLDENEVSVPPRPTSPGNPADGTPPNPNDPNATIAPATPAPRAVNRATWKAVPGRFKRSKDIHKRGQFYADALADRAKIHAARVLSSDVADIKAVVDGATSYDDLKRRLLLRFRHMDPTALARVVEKAGIMANLAGRYTVIGDL